MELLLKRVAKKETYTIGKLYIDGVFFSNTLEDKVRDLNKDGDLNDVGETKIKHKSAIGYGTYKIIMNDSVRFNRKMPLLLNVKNFEGIRIHSGNKAEHSSGCILVGINSEIGKLTDSKNTEIKLYAILNKAKSITIQII